MTVFEQAIQEGRALGLEQGREQGLEQGREQGLEQGLEQGREQGLEQGREQGLEQGLEQGRAEGARGAREALLVRQLRVRFADEVRPEVELRIRDASTPQLDIWLDRVLTAPTLAAIFAA